VNSELLPLLPGLQERVIEAGARLAPSYQEAFSRELRHASPVFQANLVETLYQMEAHASERQPEVDALVQQLTESYLQGLADGLSPAITSVARTAILEEARPVIASQLQSIIQPLVASPVETASSLLAKVEQLADREGLAHEDDPLMLLRLILEVSGKQVQAAAQNEEEGQP